MTITCVWCSAPFERTGTRGPIPIYCSAACRQRAFKARHLRRQLTICPHCAKDMLVDVTDPSDAYVVHVSLYRAEDDEPSPGVTLMTHARVRRTDDPDGDEERAVEEALRNLRPYLNNSTHLKGLAVLT